MQHLLAMSMLIVWLGVAQAVYGQRWKRMHYISDYVAVRTRERLVFRVLMLTGMAIFILWAYWMAYEKYSQPIVLVVAIAAAVTQILTTYTPRLNKLVILHDVLSSLSVGLLGILLLLCTQYSESVAVATRLFEFGAVAIMAYMATAILYVRRVNVTIFGQIIALISLQVGLLLATYS